MLKRGQWDFAEAEALASVAGRTEPRPTSVYGATKLAQEHVLSALGGQRFGVPITILRLQNVYGPGQSLTNSYTGIVTLFCSAGPGGEVHPLYEDGTMLRDFVFIDDVSQGIVAALHGHRRPTSDPGHRRGRSDSIATMASLIAQRYRAPGPGVTGAFRPGDVRHALTDISAPRTVLDYSPWVSLAEGLRRLCEWVDGEAVRKAEWRKQWFRGGRVEGHCGCNSVLYGNEPAVDLTHREHLERACDLAILLGGSARSSGWSTATARRSPRSPGSSWPRTAGSLRGNLRD